MRARPRGGVQAGPARHCGHGLVVPYELETEAQVAFEDHWGYASGFRRTWSRVDPAARGSAAAAHAAVGSFGAGLEVFFRVLKEGHFLVRSPRAVVFHRHRRTREVKPEPHG